MSFQITTAFVEGYKTNIIMLSQQKGSRLEGAVRNEMQNSKADFYERIGLVDASEILDRHGDTPQFDTPHSRRMVTLVDSEYADLIDKMDRVRLLINPDDAYVNTAVWALGRKKDDQIISAAFGDARGGEDGSVSIPLPNSQKVAAYDGATTTGVRFNVNVLRAASQILDGNDVDESIRRYVAYTSKQKQALLEETEVTSADFNTIRALVMGQINTFMGFEFIRTERLPRSAVNITYNVTDGSVGAGTGTITAAESRRCIAWAEDGLLLAKGMDIFARISERDDKRYSTQIYVAQSIGATRLEEEKVVELLVKE
jgi:hypothetical protein